MSGVTARAPCSTANLGPGFDVFGLALDAFYDEVHISRTQRRGITIKAPSGIPSSALKNTAGIVIRNMASEYEIGGGFKVVIKKGVPAGFGIGSSAASAAAAALAFEKLCKLELDSDELVRLAGTGEAASAGTVHYDNVAASILGGFVIVRGEPPVTLKLGAPADLRLCVAVPAVKPPAKKTSVSRGAVPKRVRMQACTANLACAAAMAAGFATKDTALIGDSVRDVIVEPARRHMIPGFDAVKEGAVRAGAMGATISGAGPAMIAFAKGARKLEGIADAMHAGFKSAGLRCNVMRCRPSRGAQVVPA